jgi:hypothetical protein
MAFSADAAAFQVQVRFGVSYFCFYLFANCSFVHIPEWLPPLKGMDLEIYSVTVSQAELNKFCSIVFMYEKFLNFQSVVAIRPCRLLLHADDETGSLLVHTISSFVGFDSWQRKKGIFILFATASRLTLEPTQPPIQRVPGTLSSGVK